MLLAAYRKYGSRAARTGNVENQRWRSGALVDTTRKGIPTLAAIMPSNHQIGFEEAGGWASPMANGKNAKGNQQDGEMPARLLANAKPTRDAIGIEITDQQHRLEEQYTCVPDGRSATESGQRKPRKHRLHKKHQPRAHKGGRREQRNRRSERSTSGRWRVD